MKGKLIPAENIRAFFKAVFKQIGVTSEVSRYVVNGLVEASLRGVDSHGIRLMPHYAKAAQLGRINKNPRFSFKKTSSTTIVMDADHGYGMAAGSIAMQKAVKLAQENGIGAVVVKNSSHFGTAAIYSLIAAHNEMIGLSFTHVESLVLPYGGKKPFLGTNPICFAAPCREEEPFCLDMATAPISFNKLLMHKEKNIPLEAGWAADKKGKETTVSAKAKHLLHFGGYKGYGLALMIDILCSLLTGMEYGLYIKPMYPLDREKRKLGHFFLALNISKFVGINEFKKRMQTIIDELRAIPAAPGFDRVRVAGDPEKEEYAIRFKKGIPVFEEDFKRFREVAQEVGLARKHFQQLGI